jgi:hypothetical protein
VPGMYFNKVAKGVFTGGIWHALWRFLLNPLEQNLAELIRTLKTGLTEQSGRSHST